MLQDTPAIPVFLLLRPVCVRNGGHLPILAAFAAFFPVSCPVSRFAPALCKEKRTRFQRSRMHKFHCFPASGG